MQLVAGHYESDAIAVMRLMIGVSAVSFGILVLYSIARVKDIFANTNATTFFVQNYPTGVSILFVAWGLSYHLLSHLIRIHYDSVDGREGMAGTSGRDEIEAYETNLRNALESIDRAESSEGARSTASPPRRSLSQKFFRWAQRSFVRAWFYIKREGMWFASWADGEPDFGDLAAEVRGEARAAGSGIKVLRLPMATTLSLISRQKPIADEPWTIADAGGVCVAVPSMSLPKKEQEPDIEVLREKDLDPALVRMLLGLPQ
ncbi:hypothetical protein HDU67_005108 [Dinochytrium kinnereticum]|nr:hypothetical protein HDU67_005108 [Dinochytrium kinnereticum]